jgi:hypothetical protein
VNRRRTNARAFITQVFRTMKSKPDRLSAIDTRCRAIMNHANRNVARHVISRLRPGRLKEAKDWDSVLAHEFLRSKIVIPKPRLFVDEESLLNPRVLVSKGIPRDARNDKTKNVRIANEVQADGR